MGEQLNRMRFQVSQVLNRLSGQQKVMLAVIAMFVLAAAIIIWTLASSVSYEPLFSELSQKDAGEIIDKLKERNVEYKLSGGGTTILVPAARVYELRIALAQDGLPGDGPIGYEIFDKQELGVTEFQQKIAYKRALEGELSRTIKSIDVVDRAAVFIVIPRERLFEKDRQVPTASVQLRLKNRSMPSQMAIEAIANLVANSVEGLVPENVTITDTRGRILSRNRDATSALALSSNQLEFTRKVEDDLESKALAVIEKRVGMGNASVQVTAELNWSQVEKTIQDVDPDRTVTVSEETNEESTPGEGGATGKSSNTVTNYENTRTVQRIVEGVGNIKHLSVAVLVNNNQVITTAADGRQSVQSVPRDAREIKQLEELAKSAVGFRPERNDQFSIVNMEFEPDEPAELTAPPDTPWGDYTDLLEKLFIILVIVAGVMILRSLINQARQREEEIESEVKLLQEASRKARELAAAESAGALGEGGESSGQKRIKSGDFFKSQKHENELTEQIKVYAKQNPEVASKLVKVWLMEEEEEEEE